MNVKIKSTIAVIIFREVVFSNHFDYMIIHKFSQVKSNLESLCSQGAGETRNQLFCLSHVPGALPTHCLHPGQSIMESLQQGQRSTFSFYLHNFFTLDTQLQKRICKNCSHSFLFCLLIFFYNFLNLSFQAERLLLCPL